LALSAKEYIKKISDKEYDRVCNKFDKDFYFTPSVEPKYWPGISEPIPSYTISLSEGEQVICPEEQELEVFFKNAFNQLTGNSKIYYILDWYHSCYYAPDVFDNTPWIYPDNEH